MAHTAIRLGYISISSGGGGGAGFEQFSELASFPPLGELNKIYLAADTEKIYKWNGITYVEISPSEVTSVNTKVGAVVLDKTDIGLDQVDNTSDADKPISDATQTALNGLDSRITPIEDRSEIVPFYAYENNAAIYADAKPGIKDPSSEIRDGWYFKNDGTDKINWYFFDGVPTSPTFQGTIQQSDFNTYVVMELDSLNANPIVGVYSLPTGVGDALPGFAHSRWVYEVPSAVLSTLDTKKQYLFYTGVDPDAHPELEHIEMVLDPISTVGDLDPSEIILTAALNSNSVEPSEDVQWMVQSLGVWSTNIKQEMELRIRVASQLDLEGKQDALGFTPENVANKSADTNLGTSDTLYPTQNAVKTYVDSELSTKIDSSEKGAANGVAPLNSSSKIDSTYLPSFVDDVEEYPNFASFPVTGETSKIYIALDTNLTYRWSGSVYVEISPAPVQSVNGQTNVVVLDSDDLANQQAVPDYWDVADGSTIKAHLDDLASRRESQNTVTKEPTGFETRDESVTSFSDSTPDRTFTIAPVGASFTFYVKGVKFTKTTSESLQIPAANGNHFIYYNPSGVLESTQVASNALFKENAFVAIVYWNTETNSHVYFAEERHGLQMDGETHSYLHTVFGAQYLSGLALQGFSVDGDGDSNAHAQFTGDEGVIRDEDLIIQIPAQTQIPVLYRQGTLWRKKAADAFPMIYSGTAGYTGANGRLPYNQLLSGSWQLTEVVNNGFVLIHLFGTNDKDNPIVAIQGINQYGNVSAARTAASSEISSLSGLPFAEFVALGSVVLETADGYTNTPKAIVKSVDGGSYVDFRGTQLYSSAGVATSHGLLSGLSNDDHLQYHTDARGDARYYTKAQVDSLVGSVGSPGDLSEGSYSFSNSQIVEESITGFSFSNAEVRSFDAVVSVSVDADTNLYETFEIQGIQKDSVWEISIKSVGDVSGVVFSITTSGQMQYTSNSYSGFVSGTIKFRALTTSV